MFLELNIKREDSIVGTPVLINLEKVQDMMQGEDYKTTLIGMGRGEDYLVMESLSQIKIIIKEGVKHKLIIAGVYGARG